MHRLAIPCALVVLAATAACGSSKSQVGDGGVNGTCTVTGHNTPQKAIPLTLGDTYPPPDGVQDTCIYPTRMELWFSVTVPDGKPLLTVQVGFPAQTKSRVNLAYAIYPVADPVDLTQPVGAETDTSEDPHASRLAGTHYLAAGSYYIMVHDEGDNAQDNVNTFAITASAGADPDPNEAAGNNDCAHAVAIGAGQDGWIAYQGDHDAFMLTVPAGAKIVDFTLDSKNQSSLVRYAVELHAPDGTLLYEDTNPSGGVTAIHSRRAVNGAGDYCFLVKDLDDTEADPKNGYHIAASLLEQPDANEPNDTPTTATSLGTGGTKTGFIATTGDSDWYVVQQTAGQLLELEAKGAGGAAVLLGMTLLYPHTTSPCTPGSADSCAYLTGTQTCTLPTDCDSNMCQRGRCALSCDVDLDCPGSIGCSAHACAGGAVCLPEGQCAVQQFQKQADNTNDVHTMQPAFAAKTYVVVHDTHNPPVYDATNSYTMTATTHAEPDTGEPDNAYNPNLSLENPVQDPGDVLGRSARRARALPMNTQESGYISYEGDIDVWKFPNPCGAGTDCGLTVTFTNPSGTTSCATLQAAGPGGPLDIIYFAYHGNDDGTGTGGDIHFDSQFSWQGCAEPNNVFGDGTCGSGHPECAFFWAGYPDATDFYYLVIRDYHHNKWDLAHPYGISVSFAPGCPGADAGTTGGCQRYQGTGNCYACDN